MLSLYKCIDCGVKFQHPMPTPEMLNEIYLSGHYYENRGYPQHVLSEQKLLFNHRLQMLEKINHGKKGKVLDIGTGKGMFLEAAMERGWNCVGQEFSNNTAEAVKNRLGVEMVICSEITEAGFSPESFDLVHMNHVLEHLYKPEIPIKGIYRILKPGGLFYCEVPRQNNSQNFLSNVFGKKDLGVSYLPEHLFLFDIKSISTLLNKGGLEIISMKIEGIGDPHRYVYGVHYTSLWTHIIGWAVGTFRLQALLGGGNLVVICYKPV